MLILGNLNTLLIHTSLKTFFLSHSETVTKAINTGTSTSGPITVVKATGEANPKVAIATASANSPKIIACRSKGNSSRFGTVANRDLSR
jgi:hypothetical protein